jgi:uncharacterized protein YecA (UPF0149 family)
VAENKGVGVMSGLDVYWQAKIRKLEQRADEAEQTSKHLEETVCTLAAWLISVLGEQSVKEMIDMAQKRPFKEIVK